MADRVSYFGGDVRCIGEWRFEGGSFVQILVGGDVSTARAIEYVEIVLGLKKAELEKMAADKASNVDDVKKE